MTYSIIQNISMILVHIKHVLQLACTYFSFWIPFIPCESDATSHLSWTVRPLKINLSPYLAAVDTGCTSSKLLGAAKGNTQIESFAVERLGVIEFIWVYIEGYSFEMFWAWSFFREKIESAWICLRFCWASANPRYAASFSTSFLPPSGCTM